MGKGKEERKREREKERQRISGEGPTETLSSFILRYWSTDTRLPFTWRSFFNSTVTSCKKVEDRSVFGDLWGLQPRISGYILRSTGSCGSRSWSHLTHD